MSEHGLVNEEIRRVVWPILLSLDTLYPDVACFNTKAREIQPKQSKSPISDKS